jgi:hypothetical protein
VIDHVLAKRVDKRRTPDGFLVIGSELVHLVGNARPYFSVTAELWQSEGWFRNGADGRMKECGCLHDRILRAIPALTPVVAVHLADDSGMPMHAHENGWYFYSRGQIDECARALRTPVDELPVELQAETFQVDRATFGAFVERQRPRWQEEADLARWIIESGVRR